MVMLEYYRRKAWRFDMKREIIIGIVSGIVSGLIVALVTTLTIINL